MAYRIEFAQSVRAQIAVLTAGQRKVLLAAIEQHLTHEPLVQTRSRKRLRPNVVAPWELRVGQLRVFYDVPTPREDEPAESSPPSRHEQGVVQILAVGEKRGSVLRIAGKRIQL